MILLTLPLFFSVILCAASTRVTPTLRMHSTSSVDPSPGPVRLQDLIQEFTLDLSEQFWKDPTNVAFSPLSITSLLSLLMLGSSGTTLEELRRALYYSPLDYEKTHELYQQINELLQQDANDDVEVNLATRLFLQSGAKINTTYIDQARNYYSSSLRNLDFVNDPLGAKNKINRWVNQKTKGKIPQILTAPLSSSTIFLTANTVYFKGAWETPFNPLNTRDDYFDTGRENITVPMMRTIMTVPYVLMKELNAEMIALPYKGIKYAMYIVVPKGPVDDSTLQSVEFALSNDKLEAYMGNMILSTRSIALPRMKLKFRVSLRNSLKELEVGSMFDSARADFSKITVNNHVWVDDMIHETVIDITEEGTEAASASAISLNRSGTRNSFVVNRPAIFCIRHLATGVNLFWGRILKPEPLPAPDIFN